MPSIRPNTSRLCNCGKAFSTDHDLSHGGLSTIRHNELRDMTASLLTEVCTTEQHLQPLSGETFRLAPVNTSDGARLDVRARDFRAVGQDTSLDVRVFHSDAPTNRSGKLSTV
jgi:hypothetical protein